MVEERGNDAAMGKRDLTVSVLPKDPCRNVEAPPPRHRRVSISARLTVCYKVLALAIEIHSNQNGERHFHRDPIRH
jgi:hypothetical protein